MVNTTNKDEFIVALDIGTTKVLCLVADYDDNGEIIKPANIHPAGSLFLDLATLNVAYNKTA